MVDIQPAIMLVVRGLKSRLSPDEFKRRYKKRMPLFREVPGLVQKYYAYDESMNTWAGIYLWDSERSLASYLESDLLRSVSSAYELEGPPVLERFRIVDVLRARAETEHGR